MDSIQWSTEFTESELVIVHEGTLQKSGQTVRAEFVRHSLDIVERKDIRGSCIFQRMRRHAVFMFVHEVAFVCTSSMV